MEFSLIRRFLEIGRTVPYITSTNIPGRLNVTIFCSLSPGIYLKYKKKTILKVLKIKSYDNFFNLWKFNDILILYCLSV